jgi:hypothetical protein
MADRYTKTVQGRQEIRLRALTLSRTARNLLLIIDSSRSLSEWLAMVQGSTESDGASLIEAGLIELVPVPSSDSGGVGSVASNAANTGASLQMQVRARLMGTAVAEQQPEGVRTVATPVTLQQTDRAGVVATPPGGSTGLSYSELYDCLNALLKETLGLFKGYRFSLEIERASDLRELEEVARKFADEVERSRGENVARMVRRALGLTR